MEAPGAARRPRPRLSRRRPPAEGGRPPDPPRPLREAASERDQLWTALLRAATCDQSPAGDALPPLPAARGQDPRPSPERAAPPEVFTVGPQSFLWTPLPPAPPGAAGSAPSYRLLPAAEGCPGPLSLSSASSPHHHRMLEPSAVPSAEEPPSEEGPPALGSCPMCQAPFGSMMSQLEVDGHLAQCLAESTEDVAW